jgi:hypothetical protein
MAAREDDHKDLREVKTVLQSLQRIGDRLPRFEDTDKNPGSAAPDSENQDVSQPPVTSERAPSRTLESEGAEPSADKPPVQGKRLAALALSMLAAGTVIVLAGDLFLKYWPSSSPSGSPATATGGSGGSTVATTEPARTTVSTSPSPARTSQPVPRSDTINDRAASSVIATAPGSPEIINAQELMDGGHIVAAREMLLRPDLAASQEGAWLLARSYDPSYLAAIPSPDAAADKRQAEEWYRRWRDIAAQNGMVMDDLRLRRIINAMQGFEDGTPPQPASPGQNR